MPRTCERLTKVAVLTEVRDLRERLKALIRMDGLELYRAYAEQFPADAANAENYTAPELAERLMLAATYRLTNVLNLE